MLDLTLDSGTEMQSITVANTGLSATWTNGSPSYILTFDGSSTACIAHDAEDWELEVYSLFISIFPYFSVAVCWYLGAMQRFYRP